MNMKKLVLVGAGAAASALSLSAAAVGPDFSSILTGLDSSTAVTAVVAAGVIIAGIGFAVWATKKVARFFG